jgi:hypothetical protein
MYMYQDTWDLGGSSPKFQGFFHGRTGRKKLGGRKEICPTFSDCARVVKKNDYEKFLLDSIFPTKLTEFPTKLTEFVPFIFIISQYCPTVKQILPDWLCLPNKLGGLPPPPPPGTPMVFLTWGGIPPPIVTNPDVISYAYLFPSR